MAQRGLGGEIRMNDLYQHMRKSESAKGHGWGAAGDESRLSESHERDHAKGGTSHEHEPSTPSLATLDLETKRQELDRRYHAGLLTESQAEDYREAYLRVSFIDLMDGTEIRPERKVLSWRNGSHRGMSARSIGRPSFVRNGDRDAVNPPKVYRDRTRTGLINRKQPLALGEVKLREMIAARRAEYLALPVPSPRPLDPSAPYDTDYHGSSDGRHAICVECSVRSERDVIVGDECVCVHPDREAYGVLGTPQGRVGYVFDRISGEVLSMEALPPLGGLDIDDITA
jgi:hypothetical protein